MPLKTIRHLYMYLNCHKSNSLSIFEHATNHKINIFILQVHSLYECRFCRSGNFSDIGNKTMIGGLKHRYKLEKKCQKLSYHVFDDTKVLHTCFNKISVETPINRMIMRTY